MANMLNTRALENEMAQLTIFWIALELGVLLITVWVLYMVIKAAIRDGIRESGIVETLRYRPRPSPQEQNLPDFRAD